MPLTFVTWNMDYWHQNAHLEEAWDYLVGKVEADIYLVQEARPPRALSNDPHFLWYELGGTRDWGTGLYSKKYPIHPVFIPCSHPGAFVVGDVQIAEQVSLTVISLYGLFERIGSVDYSMTCLHRTFSDLTGLLNGHMGGKRKIVLGGDLNASLQCDRPDGSKAHRIFFERLDDFGLDNCFTRFFDGFVQTHRHLGSTIPWQNDYFFISRDLSSSLKDCKVLVDDDIRRLSDHNPVVIELEL